MQPILECKDLCYKYGSSVALCEVNFTVEPGGIVGLLGPNGSGKTTLIKLAMGLLHPERGEILIAGEAPSAHTKAITAFLPDANYLFKWMRVEEQLKFYADFFEDFDKERARGMLSRLGISEKQKIKTLSKGNQEKLGLIFTMARNAKLYILDEPIAGVDPAARDFILDTIMVNKPEDATIFLCTHLISDIESILSDVIFLDRGCVALTGKVDDIRKEKGESIDTLFREVFRW